MSPLDGLNFPAAQIAWFWVHRRWPTTIRFRDSNRENLRLANVRDPSIELAYSRTDQGRYEGRKARYLIQGDRSRDLAFRTKYGIDFTDYKRLAETQANACAICGEPETAARNGKLRWLAVDHCHDTGRVRSLLCGRCNPMIGFADHSTDILTWAIDYLRRTNRQGPKAAKKPKKAITQKERLNKPAAYRRLIEKGLEAEAKGKLKRRGHD